VFTISKGKIVSTKVLPTSTIAIEKSFLAGFHPSSLDYTFFIRINLRKKTVVYAYQDFAFGPQLCGRFTGILLRLTAATRFTCIGFDSVVAVVDAIIWTTLFGLVGIKGDTLCC